jgi:acetyl/propionyl-CoA carboxylase alpha subunit
VCSPRFAAHLFLCGVHGVRIDVTFVREILANNAKDTTDVTIHASDEQKGLSFEQQSRSTAQWVIALHTDTGNSESKANEDTWRGAARVAAGMTVAGDIVDTCAHRPAFRAPRCQN